MVLKNRRSKRLWRYAICIKRNSFKNGIGGLINKKWRDYIWKELRIFGLTAKGCS